MPIDSLAINLIMLVPTAVFAIVVEKHYTAFWTGFWNFFALFVTGVTILISPYYILPPTVALMGWNWLPWLLILSGVVMMLLSYFVLPFLARIIGSSHITTSILLATYLFQYTINPNIFWISLVGSFVAILLVKLYLV